MTWVCSDCPRGGHVIRLCSPVHSVDRLVSHLSVTTETAIVVVVVAGVPRVELDQCTHLEHAPFPDTSRLPGVNCNEQRNRRHIHRLHRRVFFFFEKGGGGILRNSPAMNRTRIDVARNRLRFAIPGYVPCLVNITEQ